MNPLNAETLYYYFSAGIGLQNVASNDIPLYALAVRDGDVTVTTVPEPETYALMLAGLATLTMVRRRKRG